MNIEMVEFTPDYLIPENGKYLVKTTSTFLKRTQYLEARCRIAHHDKQDKDVTTVDVNLQTVTHISKFPLTY